MSFTNNALFFVVQLGHSSELKGLIVLSCSLSMRFSNCGYYSIFSIKVLLAHWQNGFRFPNLIIGFSQAHTFEARAGLWYTTTQYVSQ